MSGIWRFSQAISPDSSSQLYDNAAHLISTNFAQDGLQVSIAELRSYLNTTDLASDGIHPGQPGHPHVRDAFEAAALNSFYQSRPYLPTSRSCGSFTSTAATTDIYVCIAITPSSKCNLQPTNAIASGLLASTYIASKMPGSLSIAHPATAGATFDVVCIAN